MSVSVLSAQGSSQPQVFYVSTQRASRLQHLEAVGHFLLVQDHDGASECRVDEEVPTLYSCMLYMKYIIYTI